MREELGDTLPLRVMIFKHTVLYTIESIKLFKSKGALRLRSAHVGIADEESLDHVTLLGRSLSA